MTPVPFVVSKAACFNLLQILSDETKRAVCVAQTLCTSLSQYNSLQDAYIHSALTEVYHDLEGINSQLQVSNIITL